jgi:murein hydrolase activator
MKKQLLYLILMFSSSIFYAQTDQEKLEQRKAKLQEEIQAQERLLQSKIKIQKSATTVIAIQNQKIQLHEKIINTSAKQAKILKDNMYLNQIEIYRLKKELEILKTDYAKMIVKSYKSRSQQSRAMFLLSSENFLQAYKRAQYMKQYSSYRKLQGEDIVTKSRKLDTFNEKLDFQKTEKQKLIAEQEKEQQALEEAKKVQEQLVNALKKDKKKIIAEIKAKQRESRQIDQQIERLIREAIAEANRRAAEANRKANPTKVVTAAETKAMESNTKIVLTPEAKIVSDNFRANKGRLPWPVEKGTIYQGFGDLPHPVYKLLTVHNSGIDIATEDGTNARAVFTGIVTKVIVLTPVNKAVFVQHGDYFTVYQNLSTVNVTKGDKVAIKQVLGRIRTNGESGKTILKFMVMQNTTPANPSGWLSPR